MAKYDVSILTGTRIRLLRSAALLLAATLTVGVEAGGPYIPTEWKAKDGNWSGAFNDAAHWSANA